MRSRPAALLPLLLAAQAWGATSPQADNPQPAVGRYNLIMISLGNVGTAHMSLYGYPRKTTPSLDRWASGAVVFENAFSPASWTLPVGTSLFTSLYPYAHGVMARGKGNILNESIPTLPEILKRAGFATAAFTGGLDYYRGFGHMRGFDTAPDNPDFTGYRTTLSQANAWLSAHERERFFVFLHGYDAHCPFTPPAEPYRGRFSRNDTPGTVDTSRCWRGISASSGAYTVEAYRGCELDRTTLKCVVPADAPKRKQSVLTQADIDHLRNLYDDDVLSVDAQVGDFLAALSTQTLSRTIIVVYCEHGEMFAKHGRFGRPGSVRGALFDDVLHIPLLIRLPDQVGAGARVRSMVEITDVMPTLLDLLNVASDPRHKMQGKNLRRLLEGADERVHDRVYAGSAFEIPRSSATTLALHSLSVRDREWKLISEDIFPEDYPGRRGEAKPTTVDSLFATAQDPDERRDVASQRPDVVIRLKKDLRRWREECLRFLTGQTPSTRKIPPSLLRNAKERGYW